MSQSGDLDVASTHPKPTCGATVHFAHLDNYNLISKNKEGKHVMFNFQVLARNHDSTEDVKTQKL